MVLILTEDDVSRLAKIDDIINKIEGVLKDYSDKKTIMPPRFSMEGTAGTSGTIRLMLASIPHQKATGLKILTGSAGKRRAEGTYFLISLFDDDGSVRCIMSANRLTQLRTGAASAVATKFLARKDSKIVGIIGAGIQGQGQLEALSKVVSIQSGLIYDVVNQSATRMVDYAKNKLGIELKIGNSPDEVTKYSDVLVTTTTSKDPFLMPNMIEPGTHINAVGSNLPGRREVHETLLKRATVYVDSLDQVLKESGDLIAPISSGQYSAENISGEIGEVIAGRKPGRTSKEQITLFKSVGIAVEDLAVAELIYQEAVNEKLGKEINLNSIS